MKIKNIIAISVLSPVLFICAYKFGYWTMNDSLAANNSFGVPIAHFKILSQRLNGNYLMVREVKTGIVAELESYGYEKRKFNDGDSIDMEIWNKSGSTEFIFKGDDVNKEMNYHESGYGHTLDDLGR